MKIYFSGLQKECRYFLRCNATFDVTSHAFAFFVQNAGVTSSVNIILNPFAKFRTKIIPNYINLFYNF